MHFGLVGHPVAHSRSPQIHLTFAEQTGIELDYVLIDATPDGFAISMQEFFADGGRGLNVTLPHKTAAFELADEAGREAQKSGVANVLTRLADGRLRADNTDGIGLLRDLKQNLGFDLSSQRILIAGAGGAAAGVIPALLDADVDAILIVNRTPERANQLVTRFADTRLTAAKLSSTANPGAFDLLINATSASLQGQRPDLPKTTIGADTLAYDLVYSNQPTPFMTWAEALGARTADGRGMLIEQAAESFYLWHGIRPDTRS